MATNNLLVNNEQKVLHEQRSKTERSAHNLSQSRKFPCRVGYIYPFFCRKTLPSDSFKIWSNILVKQLQPLLVPQMVSFTVNTAFYWVDYSLAFPQFEYFLINQRGQHNIELPYVHLRSKRSWTSHLLPRIASSYEEAQDSDSLFPYSHNLRSFLDISANSSDEKVDALPFWTYQTIYRDYYLNIDRLSESDYNSWFPNDPSDWCLKAGENIVIGPYVKNNVSGDSFTISGNYAYFDLLRTHNVRGDYFVNSYPTPLRGDVPEISLTSSPDIIEADALLESLQTLDEAPALNIDKTRLYFNEYQFNPPITGDHDLTIDTSNLGVYIKDSTNSVFPNNLSATSKYSDNVLYRISQYSSNLKTFLQSKHSSSSKIRLSNLSGLDTTLSVTTRQLRLLESLTRKRELDIMMKPRLKNYLNTYFSVDNYKNDSLYQPVFIGSTTQQILINDIEQTTATSDSPLGRQGATAISLGNNYVGEYYCRNYGCLMGIMYILPDYDYEPAIPREWQERTPDDFYNPEFSHLSMQPILNKELFVSDDNEWNNEVLGYMGMYDNYRTSVNLVSGEFLDDKMTDVQQFAQVRRFDNSNKPEITTSFLDSNTAFDSSIFSVPTLPPFIAQCVARVEAVRPIPQIAIPRG